MKKAFEEKLRSHTIPETRKLLYNKVLPVISTDILQRVIMHIIPKERFHTALRAKHKITVSWPSQRCQTSNVWMEPRKQPTFMIVIHYCKMTSLKALYDICGVKLHWYDSKGHLHQLRGSCAIKKLYPVRANFHCGEIQVGIMTVMWPLCRQNNVGQEYLCTALIATLPTLLLLYSSSSDHWHGQHWSKHTYPTCSLHHWSFSHKGLFVWRHSSDRDWTKALRGKSHWNVKNAHQLHIAAGSQIVQDGKKVKQPL